MKLIILCNILFLCKINLAHEFSAETTTEYFTTQSDKNNVEIESVVTSVKSTTSTPKPTPKIKLEKNDKINGSPNYNLIAQNLAKLFNKKENTTEELIFKNNIDWDKYEAPYEIRKGFPYYLSGYDDEGRPIWVVEIGRMDARKYIEQGAETVRQLGKYVEQAKHIILKSLNDKATPEDVVDGVVAIVDMENLDLRQIVHFPTMSFVLKLAQEYQAVVQDNLFVAIVVNTNSVAHSLINMLKPIFGRVFEKVEIYGTNKAKAIPNILKYCPKSQIPPWYGGSKKFRPVRVYG